MKWLVLSLAMLIFLGPHLSRADDGCDAGMVAFSKTLHPMLMQSCAKCHGDNGTETPHSVSDLKTAYGMAEKLVDFINLEDSRFYIKVKQKHWLNYDPDVVGMTEDQMLSALQAWKDAGGASCPSDFKFIAKPLPLPNPLPDRASGNFALMGWDLSDANPALAGCNVSVQIQRFSQGSGTVPGSFRVKNPQVNCTKSIKITRLRFLVNHETEAYENIYDGIDQTVTGSSTSAAPLSPDEMILIERPGTNVIELTIGSLELLP